MCVCVCVCVCRCCVGVLTLTLPPTPFATVPGWRFPTAEDKDAEGENVIPDPVPGHEGFTHLRDIYFQANPSYEGRFTVPVLYDKKLQTIVNNESSEILRMMATEVGATIFVEI